MKESLFTITHPLALQETPLTIWVCVFTFGREWSPSLFGGGTLGGGPGAGETDGDGQNQKNCQRAHQQGPSSHSSASSAVSCRYASS